jgi:hypothetical protein
VRIVIVTAVRKNIHRFACPVPNSEVFISKNEVAKLSGINKRKSVDIDSRGFRQLDFL